MSAARTFPPVTGLPAFIVVRVGLGVGTMHDMCWEGAGCRFEHNGCDIWQSNFRQFARIPLQGFSVSDFSQ
jgi:hypothetical protein